MAEKNKIYEVVEHDIFHIIKKENEKYVVTLSNYQLVPNEFESLALAKDYINSKPYEMVLGMVLFVISKIKNHENQTN